MSDARPGDWDHEERREYVPAGTNREMRYLTFRHDSGDLRLKVAPATLDGQDHPGYALTATAYPGLDFTETTVVRAVLTDRRCEEMAYRFMALFSDRYDGAGSLEAALEYAVERTRNHR